MKNQILLLFIFLFIVSGCKKEEPYHFTPISKNKSNIPSQVDPPYNNSFGAECGGISDVIQKAKDYIDSRMDYRWEDESYQYPEELDEIFQPIIGKLESLGTEIYLEELETKDVISSSSSDLLLDFYNWSSTMDFTSYSPAEACSLVDDYEQSLELHPGAEQAYVNVIISLHIIKYSLQKLDKLFKERGISWKTEIRGPDGQYCDQSGLFCNTIGLIAVFAITTTVAYHGLALTLAGCLAGAESIGLGAGESAGIASAFVCAGVVVAGAFSYMLQGGTIIGNFLCSDDCDDCQAATNILATQSHLDPCSFSNFLASGSVFEEALSFTWRIDEDGDFLDDIIVTTSERLATADFLGIVGLSSFGIKVDVKCDGDVLFPWVGPYKFFNLEDFQSNGVRPNVLPLREPFDENGQPTSEEYLAGNGYLFMVTESTLNWRLENWEVDNNGQINGSNTGTKVRITFPSPGQYTVSARFKNICSNIVESSFITILVFTTVHIYPVLIKQFFEKEKTISIDLLIQ